MGIKSPIMKKICPVCEHDYGIGSVSREDLITMQNCVYRDFNSAVSAPTGEFLLRACLNCGFAYNSAFNSQLVGYDERYDNSVPSAIFKGYYEEIASFLYEKFSLKNGYVIEVGCGKGSFLKTLCALYPDVQGFGIDPSYEGNNSESLDNLEFISDIFKEEYIKRKPSLIICRHVLEHIEQPVSFLKSIREASSAYKNTPFFIEVPSLDWITDHNAFWDFCYEHCNYFTAGSLKNTLELTGFKPVIVKGAFYGQYLWAYGTIENFSPEIQKDDSTVKQLDLYLNAERALMFHTRQSLVELKESGHLIAVWGMATKGVLLCNLIDRDRQVFDYCIDINKNKIGAYVPHTGHRISSPAELPKAEKIVLVIMNPSYASEIKTMCGDLGLDAVFFDITDESRRGEHRI
jgi:hypothetical protein